MSVRRLLPSARLVWPLLVAALVIVASHRPRLASPDVSNIDKITHFAVYGLIGTLLCRLGHGWRAAIWAIVAASAFGASDEWHQGFVPGRSPEFADWVADTLGALTAVLLYRLWPRYRQTLERPVWSARQPSAP